MRTLLLAAAATIAIATPAVARDGSGYVGIDAGVMFPRSQTLFGTIDFTNTTRTDFARTDIASLRYKAGYDVDLVGGYDFGMFRLEGELGYKHAKVKSASFVNQTFGSAINFGSGNTFTSTNDFGFRDNASIFSGMVNGLLDFGGNGGPGGYAGGGVGYANVKQFNGSKSGFAWQLIAGVYTPITQQLDIGLKYRFFRGPRVDGQHAAAFVTGTGTCGTVACSPGTAFFDTDSRWQSHSLLLSLTYNFAPPAPPPPPPPPPPAPATQTCPDGSVIAATDACPPPPPPPPPPPAPVERGERGQ